MVETASLLNRRAFAKDPITAGAASALPLRSVRAQGAAIKMGLMLPYSGVYSKFGEAGAETLALIPLLQKL
jgi:hypothetical protein